MDKRPLGRTGLDVSVICLGTMTWGQQNTEAEGHAQMDLALDRGINFFDTAELYSIPPKAETQGSTETIIGTWFRARRNRDRVILASKVVGATSMPWFSETRDGPSLPTRQRIARAVEESLRRLQTDYIDLYQLHWPGRPVSQFGANPVVWKPAQGEEVAIEEMLDAFDGLVKAGKVRAIGLSNESAWGVMRWIAGAERTGKARVASVQNAYSILNRTFETGLAEIALREDVGLLAYSPLAQGFLSGKYRGGATPAGARRTLFGRTERYETPGAEPAREAFFAVCDAHGLDYAQAAIRFTLSKPFVTASIIGATTMEQLATNIDAWRMAWPDELDAAIDAAHLRHTNPCP